MNIREHNSTAWDKLADENIEWSVPVGTEDIERARNDDWKIILTPVKPVPRDWFGDVRGKDVLCLASGGGQQVPILAAAGANVTSFDNSAKQFERDRLVAERENLEIRIEQGDAADLSRFENESFDLSFIRVQIVLCRNSSRFGTKCYRVLRRKRRFAFGFNHPFVYCFDRYAEEEGGVLEFRHKIPYSDMESLKKEEFEKGLKRVNLWNSATLSTNRSADRSKPDFYSPVFTKIGGRMKREF